MLKKNYKKILIGIIILIIAVVIFHLIGNSLSLIKSHFGM